MRKLLLLMLIGVFALTGCEGPMGPRGPEGPEGEPGYGTNWKVQYITVREDQWRRSENSNNPDDVYFYYSFVPEVYEKKSAEELEFIYDDGLMQAYWLVNYNTANEVQIPLYNGLGFYETGGYYYSEYCTFQYSPSHVTFYVGYSEPYLAPGELTFRLVTMW